MKKFSTTNMKELLNCPEGFVEMFLDLTLINWFQNPSAIVWSLSH